MAMALKIIECLHDIFVYIGTTAKLHVSGVQSLLFGEAASHARKEWRSIKASFGENAIPPPPVLCFFAKKILFSCDTRTA